MLYPRQSELLGLIRDAVRRRGAAPNGRELARRMGLKGTSAVYAHLRKLEEAGFVRLTSGGRGVPLQIELTDEGERSGRARLWPRLGTIPAGPITEVSYQADEFVATLPDLVPQMRPGDYLLDVEGYSMIEAGIAPGMTLVMRPDVAPTETDVCSVYVEGEGNTLKRVVRDGSYVRLVAANPEFPEQRVPARAVRVQGVAVAALAVRAFR
ncbi:MAG: S24 family peptidase [Bacteroidota bacterium]